MIRTHGRVLNRAFARAVVCCIAFVAVFAWIAAVRPSAQHRGLFYKVVVHPGTAGASLLDHPTALAIHSDGRLFIAQSIPFTQSPTKNGLIHYVTLNSELDVVGTLGPPTTMRVAGGTRVLLYALEIGTSGFLGGSVILRDRAVTEVHAPTLQ